MESSFPPLTMYFILKCLLLGSQASSASHPISSRQDITHCSLLCFCGLADVLDSAMHQENSLYTKSAAPRFHTKQNRSALWYLLINVYQSIHTSTALFSDRMLHEHLPIQQCKQLHMKSLQCIKNKWCTIPLYVHQASLWHTDTHYGSLRLWQTTRLLLELNVSSFNSAPALIYLHTALLFLCIGELFAFISHWMNGFLAASAP